MRPAEQGGDHAPLLTSGKLQIDHRSRCLAAVVPADPPPPKIFLSSLLYLSRWRREARQLAGQRSAVVPTFDLHPGDCLGGGHGYRPPGRHHGTPSLICRGKGSRIIGERGARDALRRKKSSLTHLAPVCGGGGCAERIQHDRYTHTKRHRPEQWADHPPVIGGHHRHLLHHVCRYVGPSV